MKAAGRLQDDRRIGAFCGPRDADNILARSHQACIRGHDGDFYGYLHALAEDAQGVGDDFVKLIRRELVSHGPPDAAHGVLRRQKTDAALFQLPAILVAEFLDIGLGKSRRMGNGDDVESAAEPVGRFQGRPAARRRDDDRPDPQFSGAARHGLKDRRRVPRPGSREIANGDVRIGWFFHGKAPFSCGVIPTRESEGIRLRPAPAEAALPASGKYYRPAGKPVNQKRVFCC